MFKVGDYVKATKKNYMPNIFLQDVWIITCVEFDGWADRQILGIDLSNETHRMKATDGLLVEDNKRYLNGSVPNYPSSWFEICSKHKLRKKLCSK